MPGIFDRAWEGLDFRSSVSTPWQLQDELLTSGYGTSSGVEVNDSVAMRLSAVAACVNLLSESVAGLPWPLYRRLERGKERAVNDPRYRLFHDGPNEFQTSFSYLQSLMVHLLLRGNGYSLIHLGRGNKLIGLTQITPDRVTVKKAPDGEITYKVTPEDGIRAEETFRREEIFHVVGRSSNGWVGRSVIQDGRETFGLARGQEEFAARFFSNRANHGGVLQTPKSLSEAAWKRLREQFSSAYTGAANSHKIAVLEEDTKFQATTMTAEDAQVLESRRFQIAEITRWFGVPLHMVSELARSTNNNIEHQSIEFVTYGLMPWLIRIDRAAKQQLLFDDDDLFTEFLVDALLRGDMWNQARALAVELQNGVLTQNEWRALKNRNAFDDPEADKPHMQMNMAKPGLMDQEREKDAQ